MQCLHPVRVWYSRVRNPSGKRSLVHSPRDAFDPYDYFYRNCGSCRHCRITQRTERAIRCVLEASLWTDNIFVTLTYNNEHLPLDRSINKDDPAKFMNRLKLNAYRDFGIRPVRSFGCAEYGEDGRPHYHLIIFNFRPDDERKYRKINGNQYYTSEYLESVWGKGFCPYSEVTHDSSAYVAKYCQKRFTNKDPAKVKDHYTFVDPNSGEIFDNRQPERSVAVSLRPGIGKQYFDICKEQIYGRDRVWSKGKEVLPPRYFDTLMARIDSKFMDGLKRERQSLAGEHKFLDNIRRVLDSDLICTSKDTLFNSSKESL